MLKIIPLGGLGEIGLNMMVIEYDDVIFIIDAGLMFPEEYMLGVDIVIPAMDYLLENRDKIQGIIITHAHEDHIGALPYLLKQIRLPVYGTGFTLRIIRNKLIEFKLNKYIDLNLVNPGETLSIEPFAIEFIRVSHSTIDGVVIWASLSPGGLEDTDMKVLTLYGSRDGRVGSEDVLANAGALPADTIFNEIEGGNHTQFGYFDTTPDLYMTEDNAATITLEEQQEIIVQETTDFINMISGRTACLVSNLLGKEDARLDTVRQFRNEALSEISMGSKFIELYYRNSAGIIAVLDKYPTIKESAKKALEVLVPMIKLLLK